MARGNVCKTGFAKNLCDCYKCITRRRKKRKQGNRGKGGLHAGRPHASKNDPRVHVTTSLRHSSGKKARNDEHHSSLGAIAHGWAAYEDSQKKK